MENNKLTIKNSLACFVCSFIFCQIAVLLVSMAILLIGAFLNISNIENFSKTCLGNFVLTSVLYLAMFLTFYKFNRGKNNKILNKPTLSKTIIYILIAILTFFSLYPVVNCFDFIISKLGFEIKPPTFPLTTSNFFLCIIPMAILPAICEELLFRGLIFKGFKKYGIIKSIALTSTLFMLYHLSLQQTIYPLLFGSLLTFVMYKENNIFYTIIMHFTNNLLALMFMFLKINLFTSKIWYFILAVILLISFVLTICYFIAKERKNQNSLKIEQNNSILISIVLIIMFILWIITNIYR